MDSLQQSTDAPIVDCRGLQCPAPILRVAEAAKQWRGSAQSILVLATDVDFPVDLEAWCRTTKASLVRLEREEDGLIRAQIQLAAATASPTMPSGRARAPETPPAARTLDLTGTSGVAAMRKLNEVSVGAPGRRVTVVCDAPGFEGRLAAWTSATDTTLESVEREGARVTALLRFAEEPADAAERSPLPGTAGAAAQKATLAQIGALPADALPQTGPLPPAGAPPQTGMLPQVEVRIPGGALSQAPSVVVSADSGVVPGSAPTERQGGLAPASPPQAVAPEVVPRENRAVLLVLHNDLEALMAALMVASASACQGMAVEVYFSFWGIHLLRGERPRAGAPESNRGLLQRLLLWLVPKGSSQRLGKLHMGGLGTRLLLRLMRKRNILALDGLVAAAVSQGVTFHVCSMSMGLMGLSQRDIVELPNLSFAGVTSFAESARRSAVSLVF